MSRPQNLGLVFDHLVREESEAAADQLFFRFFRDADLPVDFVALFQLFLTLQDEVRGRNRALTRLLSRLKFFMTGRFDFFPSDLPREVVGLPRVVAALFEDLIQGEIHYRLSRS